MKKISINLLCVLILVLLAGMVLSPAFQFVTLFAQGFQKGWEEAEMVKNGAEPDPALTFSLDLQMRPTLETYINHPDSLVFNDGRKYPHVINHTALMVPDSHLSTALSWTSVGLYLVSFLLFILLMVQFIKFIINIDKGKIFVNKNIHRLKLFGWYLIAIAVLKCIAGWLEDIIISDMGLSIPGYELSAYWNVPWGTFLLGLLALLMARVWERGLQMREEQELTI